MQPGERVIWRKKPKDAYGYTFNVPARFVRWGEYDRIVIDVIHADGHLIRTKVGGVAVLRAADGAPLVSLRRFAEVQG